MSKVLVTGTAGFIGMHTALRLAEANHEVIGLDNINDYYDVNLKNARLRQLGIDTDQIKHNKVIVGTSNISFIKLGLGDREKLLALFEKERFDYVINLAAQAGVRYSLSFPEAYVDSNITGFLNILECCRKFPVKHLVYASTSSIYGLNTKTPFEESDPTEHPVSFYAATKKSNEMMAHSYAHLFDIPCTGLRFFTVYGPWGRPDMALFLFTKNILAGKPIDVYNHGNMERDFTYVDDIVEGVVRVMSNAPKRNSPDAPKTLKTNQSTAPYAIFNIGNGLPVRLMDFVKSIESQLGIKAKINFMDIQPGDVSKTCASTKNLHKAVNYKPVTKLDLGVKNFVSWYKDYYGV